MAIKNYDNITEGDIVNSLALKKAKESGVLDNDELSDKEIGILGAANSDVEATLSDYNDNKISEDVAKEEIRQYVDSSFIAIAATGYDIVANTVVNFIYSFSPTIAQVVNAASLFVRDNIILKAAGIVQGAINWIKEKIFS